MVKLDRHLIRPSAEIAYTDTGQNGTAVVLTHGAGLDHTMWEHQASALSEAGHRVVLWDLRGHGASTLAPEVRFTAADALEDLSALLDACRVERAVLVGHSIGGNLGQEFARRQGQRVAGLIAVDSTWNTGPLTRLERLGLHLAAPGLRLIPRRALPGVMARASAVTPAAIARTQAVFARMPRPRFLEVWAAAVSLIGPDPEAPGPVPMGLIRGERDRTGNIASAMPRWARVAGISEHLIPDAGHIVTWDAPEPTTRALVEILAVGDPPSTADGAGAGA